MPTLSKIAWQVGPGQLPQLSGQPLHANGPLIQIQIEVPSALATALRETNKPIPGPVEGIALVDTGATFTSIHVPLLRQLSINPVGVATVGTANGPATQSTFPARLSFPGTQLPSFELSQVIGCDLTGQTVLGDRPLVALIGRDVLANAVFVYNGLTSMFSLSF